MIIWSLLFYTLILVYKIEVHSGDTRYNQESIELLVKKSKRIAQAHIKKWNISDFKNTISGPTVEKLSTKAAWNTYVFLKNITDSSIKKYVGQNCAGNVTKEFCRYKNKTNSAFYNRSKSYFKNLYEKSFSYDSNGTASIVDYTILPNKSKIKGTVIRKFVGNVETNVIYTPDHRNTMDHYLT